MNCSHLAQHHRPDSMPTNCSSPVVLEQLDHRLLQTLLPWLDFSELYLTLIFQNIVNINHVNVIRLFYFLQRRTSVLSKCRSSALMYGSVICVFTVVSSLCQQTGSSAVAKRPRNASCLSVVSFNSTKRLSQSFIISYVGYRFNTACN